MDRSVYLKIEEIAFYNPVNPEPKLGPTRLYQRDCGRNHGHDDATIPASEVAARAVPALIYREYLDSACHIPKPDKIVVADINEPLYYSRVPGTVIYAHPGDRLHIHVLNGDTDPHSFHLHGLSYGIDSDGAWPFGTEASDHRRSDEICPGQTWTYTFDITHEMVGAWPFHDHWRDIGAVRQSRPVRRHRRQTQGSPASAAPQAAGRHRGDDRAPAGAACGPANGAGGSARRRYARLPAGVRRFSGEPAGPTAAEG